LSGLEKGSVLEGRTTTREEDTIDAVENVSQFTFRRRVGGTVKEIAKEFSLAQK
jgi:hypothetical protein